MAVLVDTVEQPDCNGVGNTRRGLLLHGRPLVVDAAAGEKSGQGKRPQGAQERGTTPVAHARADAVFSCAARHAVMNWENSGLGARGLDLNSGWNCTPTPHGWSGHSTDSTSVLSGVSPLTTRPASSSPFRYWLDTS